MTVLPMQVSLIGLWLIPGFVSIHYVWWPFLVVRTAPETSIAMPDCTVWQHVASMPCSVLMIGAVNVPVDSAM